MAMAPDNDFNFGTGKHRMAICERDCI
ncbi:uncharacterized protein G2W53_036845 [Senna tora]|uniref:Uncharacterized protein n=1 Tax=Senna tora TaxID=362788 RepID=A0A834SUR8_9FABA|nr:uncharacterized protein G2W53_036845 [Senna tora]